MEEYFLTVKTNIHDPNCSHVSHTNYTLSIQIGLLDFFLWIRKDVKVGFIFIFSATILYFLSKNKIFFFHIFFLFIYLRNVFYFHVSGGGWWQTNQN